MMPVMPHIISECLYKLNINKKISWPLVNEKYLNNKNLEIVIQVNGKKRSLISVQNDISEKDLVKFIKDKKLIDKYLVDGNILKTIYVKNRLINYIIKK